MLSAASSLHWALVAFIYDCCQPSVSSSIPTCHQQPRVASWNTYLNLSTVVFPVWAGGSLSILAPQRRLEPVYLNE